jgi:nicotinamidase/pyrazinamidase
MGANHELKRGPQAVSIQSKVVLWEVDVQRDFMLAGGALYVPGAERIIPNLRRLVDLARSGRAFLISSADQHPTEDPEFQVFPPHCIRGTRGAEIIPEAVAGKVYSVPNDANFRLPSDWSPYRQVVLEKQALDVFTNPKAAEMVDQCDPAAEFVVFGVVTEYCVRCAASGLLDRGRRVAIVTDAIETLKTDEGEKTVKDFAARGARLISTEQVVAEVKSVQ